MIRGKCLKISVGMYAVSFSLFDSYMKMQRRPRWKHCIPRRIADSAFQREFGGHILPVQRREEVVG
jgi:hypothetical protein